MAIRIRMEVVGDLGKAATLARKLRRVNVGRAIARHMHAERQLLERDLRRAARNVYGKGPKTRESRQAMARVTEVRRRGDGLRAFVKSQAMPDDRKALPVLFEGLRRWRHPVFGNRHVWVDQAADPWFYPTTRAFEPRGRAACERGMQDVIDQLS